MANYRLTHSAGHGGEDPGALSRDKQVREKDLNIIMARKVGARIALRAPWIEQRLMDEDITLTAEQEMAQVRAFAPRLAIAHHHNAGGGSGAEVIVSVDGSGQNLAASIGAALAKAGMPLRRVFSRQSASQPGKDYYYFIRNRGTATAIIIEYGFMDSAADLAKITNPAMQDKLADAVAAEVIKWFGPAPAPALPKPDAVIPTPTRIILDGVDLPGVVIGTDAYVQVREMEKAGYKVDWDGKRVTVSKKG